VSTEEKQSVPSLEKKPTLVAGEQSEEAESDDAEPPGCTENSQTVSEIAYTRASRTAEEEPSAEETPGEPIGTALNGAITLRAFLNREARPIARKQAIELTIALCDHLTTRRVPHGELTPDIITLSDGQIAIDESLGTGWLDPLNAYKAPETFKGKSTQRADVYALGVILFEMLRNGSANPVQKTGGRTVLGKNELRDSSSWVKIHPELKAVLLKCTDSNPAARFKTAADMKQALLAAGQGKIVLPETARPGTPFKAIVLNCLIGVAFVAAHHYLVPPNPGSYHDDVGPSDRKVRHSDVVISDNEKALLSAYNLVIIADKSGSMGTNDSGTDNSRSKTATGNTRWDWTENELEGLAKQTEVVMPNGLSLITFDNEAKNYSNCKIEQISDIYKNNKPDGGTNLGPALELASQQEFANQKPLLIAVISDCQISDLADVQQELLKAVTNANTKVVFFRVGGYDQAGEEVLASLRGYIKANSKEHVELRTVSFPEFSKLGLPKALADSVKKEK
jgi:serine/threonine protein kinase